MAGAFGQASGSFGSSSVFGNTTNSSNSFAPNAFTNTTFPCLPTQGLVFGANSTGAFGFPSSSTLVSTPTSNIGQASGSFGSFSGFGSTSNPSPNPFASSTSWNTTLPTQGSVFGGSSSGVFEAQSSSTLTSGFGGSSSSSLAYTPTFMSGQASGSFGSSSMFGSTSNPSHNPFSSNIFGKPAFPSSPTQGSIFGGNSTGIFGAPPSSSTTFSQNLMFGQTSGPFGSSSMFGNTGKSRIGHNLFASNTRENSASSGLPIHTSTFGGTSTGAFGRTSGFGFGVASTPASGSSEKPIFCQISNGLLGTTSAVNPFSTSSPAVSTPIFPGTVGPPLRLNTGTNIKSYTRTTVDEGSKSVAIISISAMLNYASKSHEELRWEDYELKKSGGLHDSRSNQAQGIGSNANNQHSNISFPSFISPCGSTSAPITTSSGSNPIKFSPQLPVFNTPAPSTNMNTLTFQSPPISIPAPSPNFSWFSTNAPASNAAVGSSALNQPLQNSKLPSQSVGIWSAQPSPLLTPNAPLSQPPSTTLEFTQFNKTNSFFPPIIQKPSSRSDLNQTIPALSPWTVSTFSIGNNGVVSLELGQPSLSQQFVSTSKVTDNIVAVRDPFGSQSGTSQPSIGHLDRSSMIQHGISSMPVIDKPATARVPSLLTSRHLSHRPLKLHVRKYHPKSDSPKVPFFYHTEEAQNKHMVYNFLAPRENPREVFDASTVLTHLATTKDEASSLNNVLYENDNIQM